MKSHNLILYYLILLIKVIHAEGIESWITDDTSNIDLINILGTLNMKQTKNNNLEDIHLTFPKLLEKYGYPVEEHEVKTSDGYVLTMHRIPKQGPAVLLAIGPFVSSDDFVTIGSQAGLAYQLSDAGYDVWFGNCRGNKYSSRHAILPRDSAAYWDFTYDEMGRYDMPALIDYVLETTNTKDLKLLSYCLSTNVALVLCSERPEYNDKISVLVVLSPMIYMSHAKSPILKILSGQIIPDLYELAKSFGVNSLLSDIGFWPVIDLLKNIFCVTPEDAYDYCHNILFLVCGPDHDQVNKTSLPVIYGHFPTSTSVKTLQHLIQSVRSGIFRRYDYEEELNVIKYHSVDPPKYPLEKITTKVAIIWSENDWVCSEEDLQILLDVLPNVIDVYKVPHKEFTHLDHMFARDVKTLVYDKLIEFL